MKEVDAREETPHSSEDSTTRAVGFSNQQIWENKIGRANKCEQAVSGRTSKVSADAVGLLSEKRYRKVRSSGEACKKSKSGSEAC